MKREGSSLSFLTLILSFALFLMALAGVHKIMVIKEMQREEAPSFELECSLVHSSSLGNFERVRGLVEDFNVSANASDQLGRKPLFAALESGHFKIAQYLLDHGADINARDAAGNTTLILAARFNRMSSLDFLLKNKAQINLASALGRTALFEAALVGNSAMVAGLWHAGADSRVADFSGNTVFHAAVMGQNMEVLRFLMKRGMDERENKQGQSPIELAQELSARQMETALSKQAEEAED